MIYISQTGFATKEELSSGKLKPCMVPRFYLVELVSRNLCEAFGQF